MLSPSTPRGAVPSKLIGRKGLLAREEQKVGGVKVTNERS